LALARAVSRGNRVVLTDSCTEGSRQFLRWNTWRRSSNTTLRNPVGTCTCGM